MTPQQHLAEAERLLTDAEAIEKTPRCHLAKTLATLAIGHVAVALATELLDTTTHPTHSDVKTRAALAKVIAMAPVPPLDAVPGSEAQEPTHA